MISFFSLPNLSSNQCTPCRPWLFAQPVHAEVRGKAGKKARDKWISNPATQHQVYSAVEGVNPNLRVAEPKTGIEANPPLKIHAFIADIDAPVGEDELAAGIKRLGTLIPNYLERTLSGNVRLLWLFEKPVMVPNAKFAGEFFQLALSRGHFDQVAACLDRPAWVSPTKYYTNSGDWRVIDERNRIPHELLQGWLVETAEAHLWKKDRGSLEIPLPVVWEEIQKRYSNAAQVWPGDFSEGAQGPTFWLPESASPKSAIVKPTGIYTFSAHATRPFYTWADLLGADWVDRHTSEQLGRAVEDIYHDGKSYYRRIGSNCWKPFNKEDLVLHLKTARGISTVKDAGVPSEMDRALCHIQDWHDVDGAAPFVFQKPGLVHINGAKFLNTHSRSVLAPANEKGTWGPDGNFPFLSQFFDGFFHPNSRPAHPLVCFLAWLSRFYKGAYSLNLESGQSVIILGPPGVGKSFWNQFVFPKLMGGGAEAQSYLLGESNFNSHLFEVGLWTVDDNSVTIDARTLRKWSSMLKRMTANQVFEYERKFRDACTVQWRGRVSITANADAASAAIIPDLSISMVDKLSLYRTAESPPVDFPAQADLNRIVSGELPFFARWLLDYEPPDWVKDSARFGVKAYHEESLLQVAESTSHLQLFNDIIEEFRERRRESHPKDKVWCGSLLQLAAILNDDESLKGAAGDMIKIYSVQKFMPQLSGTPDSGVIAPGSGKDSDKRLWTIALKRTGGEHLAKLPVGDPKNFGGESRAD